jgi:peroxiredoxin
MRLQIVLSATGLSVVAGEANTEVRPDGVPLSISHTASRACPCVDRSDGALVSSRQMLSWAAPEVRGDIGAARLPSGIYSAKFGAPRMPRAAVLLAAFLSLLCCFPSAASPRQLEAWTGEARPVFSLPDLDGKVYTLDAVRGRVVLVHFFATWCEPCREEMTSLSALVEGRGGEKLSVLAVNVAEVPARVRRFLGTSPFNYPVLLDADRAVTRAWGVSGLPTTFVLDRTLAARLFVEGDVDWTRDDILAALTNLRAVTD